VTRNRRSGSGLPPLRSGSRPPRGGYLGSNEDGLSEWTATRFYSV
jgi:hypothetical protein